MSATDGWLWDVTRATHIAAGFVALVVGPAAMAARKGARWHRWWGRTYVAGMATVAVTAVGMAAVRPNPFLLLVAVFSFHLAFTGYRAIARARRGGAGWPDWAGAVIAAAGGVGLVAWALWPRAAGRPAVWVIAVVFGVIGVAVAVRELRGLVVPDPDRHAWRYRHMGNMLGAYIATVSAFSAVNLTVLPPLVRWLWPTAIGVPAIVALRTRERRRLEGGRRPAARVALAAASPGRVD
jgi:hypothetical protein